MKHDFETSVDRRDTGSLKWNKYKGRDVLPMAATYLAWLDVRELHLETPAKFFEDAGVGLSNGIDFGAPGFLRLNFGCPPSVLEEGLIRLGRGIEAARKKK